MLCSAPAPTAQRHCTLRMPAVASTASVESPTVAPATIAPAAGSDDGAGRNGVVDDDRGGGGRGVRGDVGHDVADVVGAVGDAGRDPGGGDPRPGRAGADAAGVQHARGDARAGVGARRRDVDGAAQEVRRARRRDGDRRRGIDGVDDRLRRAAERRERRSGCSNRTAPRPVCPRTSWRSRGWRWWSRSGLSRHGRRRTGAGRSEQDLRR